MSSVLPTMPSVPYLISSNLPLLSRSCLTGVWTIASCSMATTPPSAMFSIFSSLISVLVPNVEKAYTINCVDSRRTLIVGRLLGNAIPICKCKRSLVFSSVSASTTCTVEVSPPKVIILFTNKKVSNTFFSESQLMAETPPSRGISPLCCAGCIFHWDALQQLQRQGLYHKPTCRTERSVCCDLARCKTEKYG